MHVYLPTLIRQSTTRNSNTQHLGIPFHHRKLPEDSSICCIFLNHNPDRPSSMPQVRNQKLKVEASNPHSCLLGHFRLWIRKRIKWNNFTERRPGQQGVRVQKSINCWRLLNISRGSQPSPRPNLSNLSLYKIWSLEQSCAMLVWLCVCIYLCANNLHAQICTDEDLSILFLKQGLLLKPGT